MTSIEYPGHAARYGHASAVVNSRLYIIGGYDGQMIDDVIIYQPARCHVLMSRDECEGDDVIVAILSFNNTICSILD